MTRLQLIFLDNLLHMNYKLLSVRPSNVILSIFECQFSRLKKRKERFNTVAAAERTIDPEMAEKLAKRAKRFESAV